MANKPLDKTVEPNVIEESVNKHIGAELRQQRVDNGLTQQDLASEIGVTFQQIQKYERGCRISAGKLYILAHALRTPIGSLFPQDEVKDYMPLPPRIITKIFRRLSPVALLHTEEVSAIVKALSRIVEKTTPRE